MKIFYFSVFLIVILNTPLQAQELSAVWSLEQIETHTLMIDQAEEVPSMQLDEQEKKVQGYDGCNHFQGNFKVVRGRLVFERLTATRRMCDEKISAIEQEFYQGLNLHDRFLLRDDKLLLFRDGQLLLQFLSQ